METIILRGQSKSNTTLILKLAKQLNFSAKKLTLEQFEDTGIAISIAEGLSTGSLNEMEKQDFMNLLK